MRFSPLGAAPYGPFILLLILVLNHCKTAEASSAQPGCVPHPKRRRVSLNDGWKFSRFEEIPDGLSYDHRPGLPSTNGTDVLRPWVLPSANEFILNPDDHHTRPDGNPGAEVPFVHPDFDDSSWETVQLPHDWAIKGPFYTGEDPIIPGSMGRLPVHGIAWYRRKLTKTKRDIGRSVYLDIDGAMSHAVVWLNGHLVGGWPYGYTSFRLDLTPYLTLGDENQLSIRLENPTDSSRWYPGAGIYRNVWITTVDETHVDHFGTFITSREVSNASATLDLSVKVKHVGNATRTVEVVTDVHETDDVTGQVADKVASFTRTSKSLPAGSTRQVNETVSIKNPRLWDPSPMQKPNLYKAITRLYSDGKLIDTYETEFGIRSLKFDANEGLLVNDQHVRIQGINYHQDMGSLGRAFHLRAAERQLEILREVGCNAIRLGHNVPAPEFLALTDRMGFLVVNEPFDTWNTSKLPADYSLLFQDWHEADLRASVRRDRNHPSIIAWSTGNEIPEQADDDSVMPFAQRLYDINREEDPSRPITASLHSARPHAAIVGIHDLISLNYQGEGIFDSPDHAYLPPHYYRPPQHPLFHKAFPDKMIFSSETAATLSSRGTYIFPVSPWSSSLLNETHGSNFTTLQASSYELYPMYGGSSPDKVFAELDRYPFVAGQFVWSGFDYLGETYLFDAARSSYFGIMDTTGFKKDRFYLYQSRWRPDLKTAHILPHWTWPDRRGKITPVHVFSAADEAELFLNGKSLGKRTKGPFEYRFRWDEVEYQPGELRVVTYKDGEVWARDSVRTAGPPSRLELKADRKTLQADGRDLVFITARVVDALGQTVPEADNLISFSVSGPGHIIATDNGNPGDFMPFPSKERHAFSGLALAIVQTAPGVPGMIKVTASGEAMKGAELSFEAI